MAFVANKTVYAAGDAEAGKKYFANKCTKCHGKVSPHEHDAYTDLDTTANPLSYYAGDAARITKAANEGYIIPEGNTDEKAKPGTNTNVPMKPWVGTGKDRLGEGNTPSQLALDMAAYFASFFDPPAAPKITDVSAKDGGAIIHFTAPKSELLITAYSVVSDPGKIAASGPDSPITITGLTNGTTYRFTVSAISNAGTGKPSSASNAVTPIAGAGPASPSSIPQSAIAPASVQQAGAPQSAVAPTAAQKAVGAQSSVHQTSMLNAISPHSSVTPVTAVKVIATHSSVPETKVHKLVKPMPTPQSSVPQTSATNTK